MAGYQQLVVWQRAMDFVVEVYHVTNRYPSSELYGLTSQTRRAAVSVPANIAEGRSRGTTREFHRFVGIALGSLGELETHLMLARRLRYLTDSDTSHLLNEAAQI